MLDRINLKHYNAHITYEIRTESLIMNAALNIAFATLVASAVGAARDERRDDRDEREERS